MGLIFKIGYGYYTYYIIYYIINYYLGIIIIIGCWYITRNKLSDYFNFIFLYFKIDFQLINCIISLTLPLDMVIISLEIGSSAAKTWGTVKSILFPPDSQKRDPDSRP